MESQASTEENIVTILGGLFSLFGGAHIIYQAIIYTINIVGRASTFTTLVKIGYAILAFYILILGVTIIFTGILMIKYGFSKDQGDWYGFHYWD